MAWYVVLMTASTLISILAIRQILFARLEERVEKSLVQEVQEFRQLMEENNPNTGEPFGDDVRAIFDVFLSRNIPDDDEFLLTLLNGRLYEFSPRALPPPLQPNSALIQRWAQVTKTEKGVEVAGFGNIFYLADPVRIRYIVEPVQLSQQNHGVFVVAYITNGEREEVNEAVAVVARVTLAVLIVASALAWTSAGRILAPVRLLTTTARSISESDLSQRIPVKGSDEIAELAITFNEMLDRLQAAFSSQRNFIDDAGHELRTPITIIRGHLELLGNDPEEQHETIELVMDELDRMSRFVNDLLLLARAGHPNFLTLETVNVGSLMEELYAKAKALAPRDWHLEVKGSGCIVADRQRLTQAVINLAQNATQHTKEGDTIIIGSKLSRKEVRFWVRDTGCGINFADQERIFERFARAANVQRRSEGAGLGLSIVSAIAHAHGGHVALHSLLDRGSTFTIVLPLVSPQESILP